MYLIDTNIAIYLRDVNLEIVRRVNALTSRPKISMLTLVELEGGVYADPAAADRRRITLDALLDFLEVESVDPAVVTAYGQIVAARGFSRPRILDRLIAATAIVHDLTIVTINAADFRDIPGLSLETWPTPAQ